MAFVIPSISRGRSNSTKNKCFSGVHSISPPPSLSLSLSASLPLLSSSAPPVPSPPSSLPDSLPSSYICTVISCVCFAKCSSYTSYATRLFLRVVEKKSRRHVTFQEMLYLQMTLLVTINLVSDTNISC